jgi:hypothetical protein
MVIHLPGDLSSFVGRAAELESIIQALTGRTKALMKVEADSFVRSQRFRSG